MNVSTIYRVRRISIPKRRLVNCFKPHSNNSQIFLNQFKAAENLPHLFSENALLFQTWTDNHFSGKNLLRDISAVSLALAQVWLKRKQEIRL